MSLVRDVDGGPIDVVERIAEFHNWDFDRMGDDQIAMVVEGQWRTYSVTLAWSGSDDTLRLILSFEFVTSEERIGEIFETINLVNDELWLGSFSLWVEQGLLCYRLGHLADEQRGVSEAQLNTLITAAVTAAEHYYPTFQLVGWMNHSPRDAIQVAIGNAYGHA